ncbi:MFS transporter [Thermoactinomyces sp. DSM 45892]|uniref:MFS transporter n=1 Tax=Thermoactinomyces sp. DSM 45892 TaxID=1882753 RepID=UPI000896F1E5|nr:MFS transporter [Thermoactinomyces sp. DSM 45892]SDY00243.1 MFS transporter, ACDE family, multidrug resistance protein [Thermoactinomyces sp. DSM 45892]
MDQKAKATSQPKAKKWILAILSSIPIIMVLGNSMLIPVLPTIENVYDVSSVQTSLLITLFSIPAGIVIPFAGILADHIGRKKVIFYSLLIYGVGGLLAGLSAVWFPESFGFLLGSRVIQGIGAAGTAPIAMVLASDLFEKNDRASALGIIESSNAMGKVLSPIIGSLLALFTWYTMFFVFPILCIPVAYFLVKVIQEPTQSHEKTPLKQYIKHVKSVFQREGRWLFLAFIIGSMTLFTLFGGLFRLSDSIDTNTSLSGVLKGFVLAIPLLALCITAYTVGKTIKTKIGLMKILILIGLGLLTTTIIFMIWMKSIIWMITILSISAIACGLILPCLNTFITSSTGTSERGIITSLYGSIRFFGVALGPTVYGALQNRPFLLFIGSGAIFALLLLLSAWLIHSPQRINGNREGHSRILIRSKRIHPST